MSDILTTLLERLPGHFKKTPDSNNYKLFSFIAEQVKDKQTVLETIQKFRDVDQAEGAALDRLGKDEGISRGSYDDETFRKFIKIQYIVNNSEGDIESLNKILRAYMGDNFISLEDGWESFLEEPASFMVNTADATPSFPHDLMKRIKPAGVAYYVLANQLSEYIRSSGQSYTFPVSYRVTNKFRTAPMHGAQAEINIKTGEGAYPFIVRYPICGKFVAKDPDVAKDGKTTWKELSRLTWNEAAQYTWDELKTLY